MSLKAPSEETDLLTAELKRYRLSLSVGKGDYDIASSALRAGRMTKPKIFDKVLSLRLPPGVWERIEAARGSQRQGDFLRDLLLSALDRLENAEPNVKSSKASEDGSKGAGV